MAQRVWPMPVVASASLVATAAPPFDSLASTASRRRLRLPTARTDSIRPSTEQRQARRVIARGIRVARVRASRAPGMSDRLHIRRCRTFSTPLRPAVAHPSTRKSRLVRPRDPLPEEINDRTSETGLRRQRIPLSAGSFYHESYLTRIAAVHSQLAAHSPRPSSRSTTPTTRAQTASQRSWVGASTITRTTGSVPDGRTSTRPSPASSVDSDSTASHTAGGRGQRLPLLDRAR